MAIVTDVGAGSGGRGCAFDERRVKRTAKSCGPDAPMAGVKFLGSSRFLGMTVTNKLWSHRGEHEDKPLKPLRREGRSVSAEPVCSCAFLFATFAHETAGAARTRSSPRPLLRVAPRPLLRVACALFFLGRMILQNSGAFALREYEGVFLTALLFEC